MILGFSVGHIALAIVICCFVMVLVVMLFSFFINKICEKFNISYEISETLPIVITVLIFVASIYLFLTYFIITNDVSIDKKVWFVSEQKTTYEKLDYVLININDDRIAYKKIIKQIACVEGDTVRITEDIVYCNDTAIGKLLKEDKQGNPLYPFTTDNETVIPKDYYFVAGSDMRSYDSRYFGLVYFNRIITKVKPIL